MEATAEPKIADKNKIIAEFMNAMDDYNFTGHGYYHINWDWLMPVVEKIEDMRFLFLITDKLCTIHDTTTFSQINEIIRCESDSKILAIHEAVYQFIISTKK